MSDYDDIMKAVMDGNLKALEELSQLVQDFPCGKDDFISRHWITNAIDCGTPQVVAWMLSKGARVGFRDEEGYTVLHSVIQRDLPDKYEIMQMLIDAGADVNAHGINDWTPAHMAAVRNDVEAIRILRAADADFTIRTRIDDYATPIEEATRLGHSPEAVDYLEKILPKWIN
jgi:ankyrin repeat protein